ncbi:hypothetical protein Pan216_55640 [Planctomycetes bacterium Pan216]|uniref:DUF1598 domain-containing protein n=1 Tax=Kolteria novifilia TaxID=2527975 RepID=A0A518BCP6_9BACT|nr:hypothetical protein Pan216_55640 [Planctomycetes bacterium Pan216]
MNTRRTLAAICCFLVATPAMAQFGGAGGVIVDPDGVLRFDSSKGRTAKRELSGIRTGKETPPSALRQVSLKGLDRELRRALEKGDEIPDNVKNVAGLTTVDYVQFVPETKDIVLIGRGESPGEVGGRAVGLTTGRPMLQLEDLVAALRCVLDGPGQVSCSIDPRRSGLAAAQEASNVTKIPRNSREERDLAQKVSDALGLQTTVTSGVPDGSRFARLMLEADYLMKRMAMGDEKVRGITSHLDVLTDLNEQGKLSTTLARWWFTPDYKPFDRNKEGTLVKFNGPGLKLLNEAVMVDAQGNKRGTGKASADWDRFSQSFTAALPYLESRYPAFADLHNLFDLMMVAALIQKVGDADWLQGSALLDPSIYKVPREAQPSHAEPVVTTRRHTKRDGRDRFHMVTIAYGGVSMNPSAALSAAYPEPSIFPGDADVASADAAVARSAGSLISQADTPFASADPRQIAETNDAQFWADSPLPLDSIPPMAPPEE